MTSDFLKKILEEKKSLLVSKKALFSSLKRNIGQGKCTQYHLFKQMISKPGRINLIAEIKKASPSKGLLREEFDILEIAKIYIKHKAAAISVLTEEKYFLGKPLYVKKISDEFHVPVLAKDFFIDEGQVYEARLNGASAVLLIAAILTDKEIRHLMNVAAKADLDCLVEVHNVEEMQRVVDCGAEIIGINNRDLRTFKVNLKVSEKIIPKIPKGKVIVAESGIKSFKDVQMLKNLGAHAVLIGETFMTAEDISAKIQEVMHG